MKRYIAAFLVFIFLFTFFSCKKAPSVKEEEPQKLPEEPVLTDDDKKEPEDTGKKEEIKEYGKEDGSRFDLPADEVERYLRFIMPFNVCSEEFSDAAQLSDNALVFTAAIALQAEFELSVNGLSSMLPLERLRSKITEYFGPAATLSDSYAEKVYYPFEIDTERELLIQHTSGGIASFLCPYALIKLEEGYELYAIDLMDPLFFDNPENQDRIFSGETITLGELEDIALQMQFRIYHVTEQTSGRLMLKSFRYENKKNIINYVI